MVSKGIALLEQTDMFNKDIRYWGILSTNQDTWANYKTFSHQTHCKQRRAVITTWKGGYTKVVQNIYGVPLSHPEENHEVIDNLNTIVQGIQTQSYDMDGMAQSNAVFPRFNSAVMAQLVQMSVTMNSTKVQLRILSPDTTNKTRSKRKYYCWSCGSNYNHGS